MKLPGFIDDYLFFTNNNETPEIMHLWVALSTLAGAAEKRIWLDRGYFKLNLNLYVILVAPPGVCAKSTSIGIGTKLLKECGYNVFEDSILKEKIIMEMCELEKEVNHEGIAFRHSSITYVASELNVLLASGTDMIKFLVNIWDKDDIYVYKTKNAGVFEVNNPYFNLIGAVVPEWFGQNLVSDLSSTGFLARAVIIFEDRKRKKVPDPTITEEQLEARARMLDHLLWMGDLYGEVTLDKEAVDFYHSWYMKQDIDTMQDHRLVAYQERKVKTHVLKVASLLALADKRMVVRKADLDLANLIFRITEKKMKVAFLMSSSNKIAHYIHRIMQILNSRGGVIPLPDLIRIFHVDLTREQFKELLQVLDEMGDAYVEVRKGKKFVVSTNKYEEGYSLCEEVINLRELSQAGFKDGH